MFFLSECGHATDVLTLLAHSSICPRGTVQQDRNYRFQSDVADSGSDKGVAHEHSEIYTKCCLYVADIRAHQRGASEPRSDDRLHDPGPGDSRHGAGLRALRVSGRRPRLRSPYREFTQYLCSPAQNTDVILSTFSVDELPYYMTTLTASNLLPTPPNGGGLYLSSLQRVWQDNNPCSNLRVLVNVQL